VDYEGYFKQRLDASRAEGGIAISSGAAARFPRAYSAVNFWWRV